MTTRMMKKINNGYILISVREMPNRVLKGHSTSGFFYLIYIFCIALFMVSCANPSGLNDEPAGHEEIIEEIDIEDPNSGSPQREDLPASQIEPTVWYGDKEGFAEQYDMTNWAWAITDWHSENPTDIVVAAAYAIPDAFEELTLAVGSTGIFPVEYTGGKKGTGEKGWPLYSPTYKVVTGPAWKAAGALFPVEISDYILLPASNKDGLLSMAYPSAPVNQDWDPNADPCAEYFNHGRPPACDADIAMMETQRNGRKVAHSEQLAIASDGGRISLFQYETTGTGLVVIAYINGGKSVEREFFTSAYDGKTGWASELPPETFQYVNISMLYQSGAGLVIGFSLFDPEWNERYILAEKDGKFVDFNYGYWEYDVWGDPQDYIQNTNGLINSEAWPVPKSSELTGEWEGAFEFRDRNGDLIGGTAHDYTFNQDGTGTLKRTAKQSTAITYTLEGNILITKWWDINYYNEKYLCTVYSQIKIEGRKMYLNSPDYYSDKPFCLIMTRK